MIKRLFFLSLLVFVYGCNTDNYDHQNNDNKFKNQCVIFKKDGFLNINHKRNTWGYASKFLKIPTDKIKNIILDDHRYIVIFTTNEDDYSYKKTKDKKFFSAARYGSVFVNEKTYFLKFDSIESAKYFFNEVIYIVFYKNIKKNKINGGNK